MLTRPDNAELARKAGLIPAASIEEALRKAYKRCGRKNPSVTVLPNGANTLPILVGERKG
jgi:hypothetical protein